MIIAVLAYLCQSLPVTSYCEHHLTASAPTPPPPAALFMTAPVTLPTKDQLVAALERDARAYVDTASRRRTAADTRRPAALRLRRDLRALAVMPLSADDRRDVCAYEVLGRVRDAITAEPNAKLMKAYLTHACPPRAGDNFVPRTLSRYALHAGQSFVHPRPRNALARAQAREWLRFIIARGDLSANDWRAVLMYATEARKSDRLRPELWGAALADAVDGDWSKIGLTETDVLALARKALGDAHGRAGRRRLRSIAKAFYLSPAQTRALGLARVEPPRRDQPEP